MLAKLERADGAVFDPAYINGQIDGKELLRIHKRYVASGDDPMASGASIVGVTGYPEPSHHAEDDQGHAGLTLRFGLSPCCLNGRAFCGSGRLGNGGSAFVTVFPLLRAQG